MIVKSCHIEGFGAFRDADFDFCGGLNEIEEPNGWGKSTLAAFIKCMFYGIEPSRRRKQLTEYKKYEPWDGGSYGGSLVFGVRDREYRVIRFFGKNENDFELYDALTGIHSNDYSSRLGEELFGIDREAFERSIFIKLDSDKRDPELNDSISAKLNDLVNDTDDINNFETAYEQLDTLAVSIRPKRGTGGQIGRISERITEINGSLMDCAAAEKAAQSLQARLSCIYAERSEYEKRAAKLKAESAALAKRQNNERRSRLIAERDRLTDRERTIKAFFRSGKIPDEAELDACGAMIAACSLEEKKLAQYMLTDDELRRYGEIIEKYGTLPSEQKLNECMLAYDESIQINAELDAGGREAIGNANIRKRPLAFAAAAALAATAAVMSDLRPVKAAAIIAAAIAAALSAVFLLFGEDFSSQSSEQIRSAAEKRDRLMQKCLTGITEMLPDADTAFPSRILAEIREDISEARRIEEKRIKFKAAERAGKAQQYNRELDDFFADYSFADTDADNSAKLSVLRGRIDEYRLIRERLAGISADTAEFDEDGPNTVTDTLPERSAKELEADAASCRKRISELANEAARTEYELNKQIGAADNRRALEDEKQGLAEQKTGLIKKYNIITDTMALLKQAKDNLSGRYMHDMREHFNKYLGMLDPQSSGIILTSELDTRIVSKGREWESGHQSRGSADLINICTRLALIDVMYKNERPFIILDDPFVNLDDKRTEAALGFLGRLAGEGQVFYFTCNSSRSSK